MATLIVTNTNDSGAGSLRQAVLDANTTSAADIITFAGVLAGQTISLTTGQLSITSDITIDGDVDADDKADITIDANNASRIIDITGATTDVDLLSLTFSNGGSVNRGGGVYGYGFSSLDITDSSFLNNTAQTGGGLAVRGSGAATVTDSFFSGNTTSGHGGAIYAHGSTILDITNTTIVDNSTTGGYGAGIVSVLGATVNLFNSTVFDNHAATTNSTPSSTTRGGGIATIYGTVNLSNSVVALNTSGTSLTSDDVRGSIASAGNSFVGTVETISAYTGGGAATTTNGGGNPLLDAPADNGGTVFTVNIQSGSPLIDAGDNALIPGGVSFDANGAARIANGTVDIGAVEFVAPNLPTVANDDAVGPVDENVVLTGGNLFADNGSGADNDPESDPFSVTEINGNAANVGSQFALASGALVLVNSDGTFSYDPNGTQDALPGAASGATNTTATDTFTYTVTDGETATVTVTIQGVDSDDTLIGTAGNDTLDGGVGNDTIDYSSAAGNLIVNLNLSAAQNTGGAGTDTIANVENLIGGLGADRFIGRTNNNTLDGGDNADQLFGIGGDDTLNGGGGNDIALAGAGIDTLNGGAGDDILKGGTGNDTLTGGIGRDQLWGEEGADTFVFNDIAESGLVYADRDIIRDFNIGDGDKIDLSGIDANINSMGDDSFTFLGTFPNTTPSIPFTNTAGELFAVNTLGGQTVVWGDVDGDGVRDFTFVLDGVQALTSGDFIL